MRKGSKCCLLTIGCLFIIFFSVTYLLAPQKPWDQVQITLPVDDFTNFVIFQGYGKTEWNEFHNGLDFCFNSSVEILSPCDGYIIGIELKYNEDGGHWQTNLNIMMNLLWSAEIVFESIVKTETLGKKQFDSIKVKWGQRVSAGDLLGILLFEGEIPHIHFSLNYGNNRVCPYQYFTDSAQNQLDAQLKGINFTDPVCN